MIINTRIYKFEDDEIYGAYGNDMLGRAKQFHIFHYLVTREKENKTFNRTTKRFCQKLYEKYISAHRAEKRGDKAKLSVSRPVRRSL
jgi:hypothetical protein